MNRVIFVYMILAAGIVGCKDKSLSNPDTSDEQKSTATIDLSSVESLVAYSEQLDEKLAKNGTAMPSLSFSNDDESFRVVLHTLQNVPVKMEEHFMSNRKVTSSGIRTFYISNDSIIMAKELREEMFADGSFQMVEMHTFYKNGKTFKTIERSALYQEELPNSPFREITVTDIPVTNAKQILSLTGPYQTNYLGSLEAAGSTFLLLGDPSPNGFTTALLLEFRDPFVKMLLDQKDKYKGKRLQIEFETVTYEGVEYQAYRKGKLAE
jgi:hypothetical protein